MHLSDIVIRIRKRRKTLGISQKELADLAKINLRTLKGLESGKSNPTIKTMMLILEVLGLELTIKTKK